MSIDIEMLARMTQDVRDRVLAAGNALAGQCEGAAGDLAADLAACGHEACVAWGEYDRPCPEGHPTTGHCWVQIDGMIADPARAQFDDLPMVCAIGGSDATSYRLHYAIPNSSLDD